MSEILGAQGGQFIGIGFAFIESHYFRSVRAYLGVYLVIRRFVWRKTEKDLGPYYAQGKLVSTLTQSGVAKRAGVSLATAKRAIWALEQNGWLRQEQTYINGKRRNVLVLGKRTKTKGAKGFTGETYLADVAIANALAAEASEKPSAQMTHRFKTKTDKDYRAFHAKGDGVTPDTQEPSPLGVTPDTLQGVTPDTTHGVTGDTTSNRELLPIENSLNTRLPSEDDAPRGARSSNGVGAFPGGFEHARPSGAMHARHEEHTERNQTYENRISRAAPSGEQLLITWADASLPEVDGLCASGDAALPPGEEDMTGLSDEEKAARRYRNQMAAHGEKPIEDGLEKRSRRARNAEDEGDGAPGRKQGKKRTTGPGRASGGRRPAPPPNQVPNHPYDLYTHFQRVVRNSWPKVNLPRHNGRILAAAKRLLPPDDDGEGQTFGYTCGELFEMIQLYVLDFDNFAHAKIFLKFGVPHHPTFEQFCGNVETFYPFIGTGVTGLAGTARSSEYRQDYLRRHSDASTGAQPPSPPECQADFDAKSLADRLRAEMRTEAKE